MTAHPDSLAPPPLDPAGEPLRLPHPHLDQQLQRRRSTPQATAPPAAAAAAGPSEAGMLGRKVALAGVSNMVSPLGARAREIAGPSGEDPSEVESSRGGESYRRWGPLEHETKLGMEGYGVGSGSGEKR